MTEREQFEAWAKSKGAPKDGWWVRQIDDGGYSCHAVDMAWEAWQAEVQALRKDAECYRWLRRALADRTRNGVSHFICLIAEGHPEELWMQPLTQQ